MEKICIIKFGALGDVVRTIPLIDGIKDIYPDSEITWVTLPIAVEILKGNQKISKIIPLGDPIDDKFDILYSLDIESEAGQLALRIKAEKKYGYYDLDGFPAHFNPEAEYYLNTLFDDELKKLNRKTYQEIMFETCKLKWEKQLPSIFIPEDSKKNIDQFIQENNLINKKIIGLNVGSSKRWPSKAWHPDRIKDCIKKIKERDYEVILLGGPEETQSMETIEQDLRNQGTKVYMKNTANSLKDFFALVNQCETIICADTLACHVALALRKPTIGLFFCTPPYEIEGYGLLNKIVSPMLNDFFPEKMDQYDESLVKSITVDEVLNVLDNKV